MEIRQIREVIDDLANNQERSLLVHLGFDLQADYSTDDSSEDGSHEDGSHEDGSHEDGSSEDEAFPTQYLDATDCYVKYCHNKEKNVQNPLNIQSLLVEFKYNWFHFLEQYQYRNTAVNVEALFNEISKLEIDAGAFELLEQFYQAYFAVEKDMYDQDRIARCINEEVVSESESDDPESYVGLSDPFSEVAKSLVVKRRDQIQQRARRQKAKAITERRFFVSEKSKKSSRILTECPDIGKTIETYVQERNIGADAWRRTGVLTFDGNINLKQKATYEGVRLHLQHVYNRPFSYGTVVQ